MSIAFPQLAAIRLGFGLSPLMQPPNAKALLKGVTNAGPGPEAMTSQQAQEMGQRFAALQKARKTANKQDLAELEKLNQKMARLIPRDLQRRLARSVDDPTGFGERLVQFWADHFTVSPKGPMQNALAMAFVDEAIRPHLNGHFEQMYVAAETHPMMLLYLDQTQSRGPNSLFARRRPARKLGLNENLAREALELHSLGPSAPYTQKDVRELAELLTGLTFDVKNGVKYHQNMAEPGAETVLGVSYGGRRRGGLTDIHAALRDIARRPETAQYISRKLAVHFVSDRPSPGLVDAMAATWRETNGNLPDVYRVMVTHPDLASNLRSKVRQPFDYLAASFRALGISGTQIAALDFPQLPQLVMNPMIQMGQHWSRQTGPDGWPEEAAAWVSPQLLAARINFSLHIPSKMLESLPDPRELLQTALGGTQSEHLAWAVPKAESRAEGVALILASNDFNRR